MDGVVVGIVSGVFVLFVGALAWLAYNHRNEFKTIVFATQVITFGLVCWLSGYNQGVFAAADKSIDSWSKIKTAILPNYWPYLTGAFLIYTMILNTWVVNWKDGNRDGDEGGGGDEPPA